MPIETDQNLVAGALADRNTYGRVIVRYEPVLRRYVRRLLGSHGSATDDVLQEVFIKSYVNLNDYDQAQQFGPWIFRIAHNEAISYLRKTNSIPQPLAGDDAVTLLEHLADADDPDKIYWRGKAYSDVRNALVALDTKYREVLTLRYLEDQNYDAIADILHLPPGTVATLIRRGLLRLKAIIDPAEGPK